MPALIIVLFIFIMALAIFKESKKSATQPSESTSGQLTETVQQTEISTTDPAPITEFFKIIFTTKTLTITLSTLTMLMAFAAIGLILNGIMYYDAFAYKWGIQSHCSTESIKNYELVMHVTLLIGMITGALRGLIEIALKQFHKQV